MIPLTIKRGKRSREKNTNSLHLEDPAQEVENRNTKTSMISIVHLGEEMIPANEERSIIITVTVDADQDHLAVREDKVQTMLDSKRNARDIEGMTVEIENEEGKEKGEIGIMIIVVEEMRIRKIRRSMIANLVSLREVHHYL